MEKANVGAYISIGNQSENYSEEEQKQKLETWASENDARIYDFYVDKDISKRTPLDNRQEFKRLLSDINGHKVDSILAVDYGRLSADRGATENLLEDIQAEGIRVYSITDVIRG